MSDLQEPLTAYVSVGTLESGNHVKTPMDSEPSRIDRSHRKRVTLVLAFLSSEECREACRQVVPPERLAYEWCRLWFDEIYLPSVRYLEGLKGDRSEEEVEAFRACFRSEELEAMERFHRFLELRVEMLSEEAHRKEAFPQSDAWDSIVRHAGYVLEDLESVDPDAVRGDLANLVHLLVRESDGSQEEAERSLLAGLSDTIRQPQLLE